MRRRKQAPAEPVAQSPYSLHTFTAACTGQRKAPTPPMSLLRPLFRSPRALLLPLLLGLAACSAGRTEAPATPEVVVITDRAQPLGLVENLPGWGGPLVLYKG